MTALRLFVSVLAYDRKGWIYVLDHKAGTETKLCEGSACSWSR